LGIYLIMFKILRTGILPFKAELQNRDKGGPFFGFTSDFT
jgi:hypothetical protein